MLIFKTYFRALALGFAAVIIIGAAASGIVIGSVAGALWAVGLL